MNTTGSPLNEADKEFLRQELRDVEGEIQSLKLALSNRQKHAAELKRKLGISPFADLTDDINRTKKLVTDSEAYQLTAEVTAAAADTVKEKWQGVTNSSIFKSFEAKVGSALDHAKSAASTSLDFIAEAIKDPVRPSH
ncbi:unnamed protein product [Caenorhabditis auriculariae]|uniref:Uncharacterized protein n=1 Tax=Caenorhabditis auriculariae TaxID=2777116 RepID=A0A8S1GPM4_9PELO|nr:unnamed protein product [Caenorhabditis auriculariae]